METPVMSAFDFYIATLFALGILFFLLARYSKQQQTELEEEMEEHIRLNTTHAYHLGDTDLCQRFKYAAWWQMWFSVIFFSIGALSFLFAYLTRV